MKIRYKVLFLGLMVSKVIYRIFRLDFQAYLLAFRSDHCDSDPFLGLLSGNFDTKRDVSKVPYLPFFQLKAIVRVRSSSEQLQRVDPAARQ